jgi:transcriptional regulator
MYQPTHGKFSGVSPEQQRQLIREYPLATMITQHHGLKMDLSPCLLDGDRLATHVPRRNSVWQAADGRDALLIFHGPNAYISPSWYPSKHEHGKAVPTWNYAVVEVSGTIHVHEDPAWLRSHLEELTATHEQRFVHPWTLDDAPDGYIDSMIGAIVGLEVSIVSMNGKFKLSQNRSDADQLGVMAGLTASESALLEFTRRYQNT